MDATDLAAALDAAFAGLPKPRHDSHLALLGAARAIEAYVLRTDPCKVIDQSLINGIFAAMFPYVVKADAPFPRYFTAQEGRFGGDRLYLRCDDRERSVFVLEDGSEEQAGGCCRYGACISMASNGSWQEITEQQAKELLSDISKL